MFSLVPTYCDTSDQAKVCRNSVKRLSRVSLCLHRKCTLLFTYNTPQFRRVQTRREFPGKHGAWKPNNPFPRPFASQFRYFHFTKFRSNPEVLLPVSHFPGCSRATTHSVSVIKSTVAWVDDQKWNPYGEHNTGSLCSALESFIFHPNVSMPLYGGLFCLANRGWTLYTKRCSTPRIW